MTAFWLSNSQVKILKGVGNVEEEEAAAKELERRILTGMTSAWTAAHDSDLLCLVCVDVFDLEEGRKEKV